MQRHSYGEQHELCRVPVSMHYHPSSFLGLRSLGATLYYLAKRLGKIISLTLTLHYSLSPLLKRMKMRDPEHHKYDNAPPEVALIATVIVMLKLAYGFDGKRRYVKTLTYHEHTIYPD
jgi:hypothetical protein